MTRKNLISESGAVMLEVVAVVALMGMMGAALFRQMYLRNQELSNIQMASEIRAVKDAVAAWLSFSTGSAKPNGKVTDDESICKIYSFLPESYRKGISLGMGEEAPDCLTSSGSLASTLPSFSYDDADYLIYIRSITLGGTDLNYSSNRTYALVVPTEQILPDDWNFRRAARVARLIGVDGGVYDPTITKDTTGPIMTGTMGTWSEKMIHFPDLNKDIGDDYIFVPTYLATTGVDIFQPEIEVPDASVNLKEMWDLAVNQGAAAHSFMAGGLIKGSTACYQIYHDHANAGKVSDDSINPPSATCQPAFYVESGDDGNRATGNVRVANNLSVGYNYADSSSKILLEATDDTAGRIVVNKTAYKKQVGSSTLNSMYKLDPAYTSVINDARIMSRGGAKLSEILPNYILKHVDQYSFKKDDPSYDIAKPDCPAGYRPAISVQPTLWDNTKGTPDHTGSSVHSGHPDSIENIPEGVCVEITGNTGGGKNSFDISPAGTDKWKVYAGYSKDGNSCTSYTWPDHIYIQALIHTYCVFRGTAPTAENKGSYLDCKLSTAACTKLGGVMDVDPDLGAGHTCCKLELDATGRLVKEGTISQTDCNSAGGTYTAASGGSSAYCTLRVD